MRFPRAQGGAWGEVPALLRWGTEQGQETQQRIGSLVSQENPLSPEEQPSVKGGGKPCIFSGGKQGFFLRTLDTAQSLPHLPRRAARPGRGAQLALGASVPGRTSPALFVEQGWGHQPCVPGNVEVAGVGQESCGKALRLLGSPWDKKWYVPASVLHF